MALSAITHSSQEEVDYMNIFFNSCEDSQEQRDIQIQLNEFYNNYMGSPEFYYKVPDSLDELKTIRTIEDVWNSYEEKRIENYPLPATAKDFSEWYSHIQKLHKENEFELFEFFAEEASLEQVAYYVFAESEVDGRFDDLISLAQIGMDGYGKLIIAENYWDEMGRGNLNKMHTVMFNKSANYMRKILNNSFLLEKDYPVAGLKNSNLLSMCALRRRYGPRFLGAMGILEDTAGDRFVKIVKGLRRNRAPEEAIAYHEEHIDMDSRHGKEWKQHVLDPLINTGNIELMHEIAKGILIRYNIAMSYYNSIYKNVKSEFLN